VIGRVIECTRDHDFATLLRFPRKLEVLASELCATV
jgi:hypothetical protein